MLTISPSIRGLRISGEVVLGWSYGVPVEGVADRSPERVGMVVKLDGHVVRDGMPMNDEVFSGWPAKLADPAKATGWMPPPTAEDLADVLKTRCCVSSRLAGTLAAFVRQHVPWWMTYATAPA